MEESRRSEELPEQEASVKKQVSGKSISKAELAKYDSIPHYFYTEKDLLNRVTVLKESGKEIYLVAGRYTKFENDSRVYSQLTDEEKGEVEKQLRMGRKDALISFL